MRILPRRFGRAARGRSLNADDDFEPGSAQEWFRFCGADGVSGEVLYPTHGLKCLSLDNHELEAACCRVYNDWLIDYCSAAPDRMKLLPYVAIDDEQYSTYLHVT